MNHEVAKRVYLYGLDNEYHVVRYECIPRESLTITELVSQAASLKYNYPNIVSIFAVDNSYSVYSACCESMKTNSVENRVIFKLILETDGFRML